MLMSTIARTMMLHSAIHWPDVSDARLWPLAVQYAIDLFNHVPDLHIYKQGEIESIQHIGLSKTITYTNNLPTSLLS